MPVDGWPRCIMCSRPAGWIKSQRSFGRYCSGGSCKNRDRICQRCSGNFNTADEGATSKYCSPTCARIEFKGKAITACAWCNKVLEARDMRRGTVWPQICQGCIYPIRHVHVALRNHHVPHERARQLAQDPRCEICGRDIVTQFQPSSGGRPRTWLAVDHDHKCCSGSYSCGACVRGLLCVPCNSAIGMLGDNIDNVVSLFKYMENSL